MFQPRLVQSPDGRAVLESAYKIQTESLWNTNSEGCVCERLELCNCCVSFHVIEVSCCEEVIEVRWEICREVFFSRRGCLCFAWMANFIRRS